MPTLPTTITVPSVVAVVGVVSRLETAFQAVQVRY